MVHSFEVKLAVKYGLNEAIIYQYIQNEILFAMASKHIATYHDGIYWARASLDYMANDMPYFSKRTIRRTLDSLIEKGVLIKGNFNDNPFDRTCWYAFKEVE